MKHRGVAAAGLALLAVAGVALWWSTRTTSSPSEALVTPTGRSSVWPPHTRLRYAFEYGSEETVRPLADVAGEHIASGDGFTAALHLKGELELDVYSAEQHALELRLVELETSTLTVGGSQVPGLAQILTDGSLFFEMGEQGVFTDYRSVEGASPLLVQTLRVLGMRLQIAAPPLSEPESAAFDVREQLPHGGAQSQYRRSAKDAWTRVRPSYLDLDVANPASGQPQDVELSATAQIRIKEDGVPASIEDFESIAAKVASVEVLRGTSNLKMTLLSAEAWLPAASPMGTKRAMAEVPTSDQLRNRLLSQRTEGLTRASAIEMLRKHINEGVLPDHKRAMWRLTGLLELDPEFAKDLLALLLDPNLTSKGRALLLDLLVSVGNDEAQAAVRAALDAEVAKKDPSRGMQYQRLGLIDEPNIDTMQYAQDALEQSQKQDDLESRLLNAYTAGAVAGHAADSDDPAVRERAAQVAETISGLLGTEQSPKVQKHLIKALSNVKDPKRHEQIASFADSEDDGVRQSVARGLKDPPSARGLQALLALAGDSDPLVQGEAIRALEHYRLADEDWNVLIAIIERNGLHRRNHRILLDYVKYHRDSSRDATTRLLNAMLQLPLEGEVAGAVRLLLAR